MMNTTTSRMTLVSLILSLGVLSSVQAEDSPENPPPGMEFSDAHQFVFFAVLEGCYADGLTSADVDLIAPKRVDSERRDMTVNMVLTCPLCSPAFDAINLYSGKKVFRKQLKKTAQSSTFGSGLSKAVRAELAKPGQPCRDALQGLIQEWVEARIMKLRLSKEETAAFRKELAKMRKEGEDALARFKKNGHGEELLQIYKDWEKGCPVCSGASPMGGEKAR